MMDYSDLGGDKENIMKQLEGFDVITEGGVSQVCGKRLEQTRRKSILLTLNPPRSGAHEAVLLRRLQEVDERIIELQVYK